MRATDKPINSVRADRLKYARTAMIKLEIPVTAHIDFKKRGIAKTLLRKAYRMGMEKGYDICTGVPDEGHPVGRLMEKLSDEMNITLFKLHRFTFLSKLLDNVKMMELANWPLYQKKSGIGLLSKKASKIHPKNYDFDRKKDLNIICEMLNASYKTDTLTVNWDTETLSIQLEGKPSGAMYLNQDDCKALITYYSIDFIGCRSKQVVHKMTVVENVHFENISFFKKHRFVSDFCVDQKKRSAVLISIPTSPIFDLMPFYSNTFLPSGRYHTHFVQCLNSNSRHESVI